MGGLCMKQKIIFLDVDGVLNGVDFWHSLGWEIACFLHIQCWYKKYTRKPFGVHEDKVKRLAKIVHNTGAKVVMSSTWRGSFWNVPYDEQFADVRKLTDLLSKYHIDVIGITPKLSSGFRQDEILHWLKCHNDIVDNFIVLDDEKFDLISFNEKELIQTTSYSEFFQFKTCGLNDRHVKQAIALLNS